ncbi:MAG: helix-hairpin-helix domain-containing protein, partial [Planctomycetota bacterium]
MDDLLDHVRLACVPGVGSAFRRRLLEHFGSPQAVLAAAPREIAAVARVGPKLAAAIAAAGSTDGREHLLDLCRREGVDVLGEGCAGSPAVRSRLGHRPGGRVGGWGVVGGAGLGG